MHTENMFACFIMVIYSYYDNENRNDDDND